MRIQQRRSFLRLLAGSAISAGCSGDQGEPEENRSVRSGRFLFTSAGRTGVLNTDGTGLRYLGFDVPNQVRWQPGPVFRDGRRLIFLSIEEGAGQAWKGEVQTRLWLLDSLDGSPREIVIDDRPAPYMVPCCLLPGEERFVVQGVAPGNPRDARLYSVNLDGTNLEPITPPKRGHHYCPNLDPDGKSLAFHATGPRPHGYRVFTCDIDGSNRVLVAGKPGHLYFGVHWSPDGEWLLYQDCLRDQDPGHDWSDLCIGRPDGSEHRVLTEGQSQWFAAAWGDPENHGSGSNVADWTPEGRILYTRKLPGSQPAFQWSTDRPDTDHFNREFKPEEARGGTELCLLSPEDASVTQLTRNDPPQWDWGARTSPDGQEILFVRATTGGYPAIWVMANDGSNQRLLTRGYQDRGAFVSKWWPAPNG